MIKNNFIKESFINLLSSSLSSLEEAASVFRQINHTDEIFPDSPAQGVLFNLVNRREYLKELCKNLNDPEQKLFFLTGFQGTGKTSFSEAIFYALEENVLDFYYECSAASHLDDIILALFTYLKKHCAGTRKKSLKIAGGCTAGGAASNVSSVDLKLVSYIQNLERPLLIMIDGFENLFCSKEEHFELIHFVEFLSAMPEIKIIISGRNLQSYFSDKQKTEKTFEMKLGALEEKEAAFLMKTIGINETESGTHQILEVTRGYPENILLFASVVKNLCKNKEFGNIATEGDFRQSLGDSYKVLEEYFQQEDKGFEDWIFSKICGSIPDELKNIAAFFCSIRHPISLKNLIDLNFEADTEQKTSFMLYRMILCQNRKNLYIKTEMKNTLYASLSNAQKKHTHRFFYGLYSEQIAKKLEERIFFISRKVLYSEQYYHYKRLIALGEKVTAETYLPMFNNRGDFKYIYTNPENHLGFSQQDTAGELTGNTTDRELSSDFRGEEKKKLIQNTPHLLYDDIIYSDSDIALSEEEKHLLLRDNTTNKSENTYNIEETEAMKTIPQSDKLLEVNKISQPPKSPLEERADNLKNQAEHFYKARNFSESLKKFNECLVLYENINDINNINRILTSIADIYSESYRHDTALKYYLRVIGSDTAAENIESKVHALCSIADIYGYRRDYENALKSYDKALEEVQAIPQKPEILRITARIFFQKALAYDDMGNFDSAIEFYEKNISASTDTVLNPNIASSFSNMAAICEERGNLNKAKEFYLKSLEFDKKMNNTDGQYENLSHIGNILFEAYKIQESSDYYHLALAKAKELQDEYKTAMSYLDIGDIYLYEKNWEKAIKAYIIARKVIAKTISTDSREKIDRRLKNIISEIGENKFRYITEKIKIKK